MKEFQITEIVKKSNDIYSKFVDMGIDLSTDNIKVIVNKLREPIYGILSEYPRVSLDYNLLNRPLNRKEDLLNYDLVLVLIVDTLTYHLKLHADSDTYIERKSIG